MTARADNLTLALGAMLAMTFALSLGDAALKGVSADPTLWQIFVIRSVIALLAFPLLLRLWQGDATLAPRDLLWVGVRTGLLVLNWITYYASLPLLPLPVAAATLYTLPLFIMLFAALFGGERVAALGWVAAGIGFAGVTLVLDPGAEGFGPWSLLPLGAAILYALSMVTTRTRCRDEHPLCLAAALHLGFIAAGVVGTLFLPAGEGFLAGTWRAIGAGEAMTLGVLTASILIGSVGTAVAYQNAPSSVIGPFDFSYVGFATLWGILVFAETPGPVTLLGMGLIVGAGILAIRARPAEAA